MLDFRTDSFLMVCETLNFTEAARRLHITQPAVSQHVHYLEKEYGTQFFSYQNKQLQLTEAGQILKKRLLTMKNDEKVLQRELAETKNGVETLSMGVTMTVGEYAIVRKLASFLKKHPSLNLHVRYGNTEQLLKLLDAGKIDFALVEGNYRKEGYEHRTYSTESYIGVCAANHVFQTKALQNMRDLLQERLLVREKGSGTRNILEQNLQVRGLSIKEFKHYVEVENMHTIIELLKHDCGISFMYKIAVEKELEEGVLKEIALQDFCMQHDFDFIWEKGSIYTERYAAIGEELKHM